MRGDLVPKNFAAQGQACAALVNAYGVSGDVRFKLRAKALADFLVANAFLAGDGVPGWGPKTDLGYGYFADKPNFTGKDLWETSRALDCLLKYSEIDPANVSYVELAKKVVDSWPFVDKQLSNAGPYAAAGMRFYYKDEDPHARKYVKNTNLSMAEALLRLAKLSGNQQYSISADRVINAEKWEVLTRHNFGYHGAMIYVDTTDPQNVLSRFYERKKVTTDSDRNIVCRDAQNSEATSCWDHLAFEAYEVYQLQLLSGGNLNDVIGRIMHFYHGSERGDTSRFHWKSSPTAITAYNCYLRNLPDTLYRDECLRALQHPSGGAMIFYSLVPDDIPFQPR